MKIYQTHRGEDVARALRQIHDSPDHERIVMLGEKASGEPFNSADRAIVQAMARHIGVGIYQRNLMMELERKAAVDRQ